METFGSAVSSKVRDRVSGLFSAEETVNRRAEKSVSGNRGSSVKEEDVKSAVNQANKLAVMFDRSLKFEYRQEADIYQVSVIDTSKDEVVRKIPPDEVVRFIESIKDLFGALLDITA